VIGRRAIFALICPAAHERILLRGDLGSTVTRVSTIVKIV
jgi:hypothetical protein